jgi:hypothetical protein
MADSFAVARHVPKTDGVKRSLIKSMISPYSINSFSFAVPLPLKASPAFMATRGNCYLRIYGIFTAESQFLRGNSSPLSALFEE